MVRAAPLVLLIALSGCSKLGLGEKPGAACADVESQNVVISSLYDNARKAVDTFVADGTFESGGELKAQIADLEKNRLLTVRSTSFEGYDEKLHRTTCAALVAYAVPAGDRSLEARSVWSRIHGIAPPPDLLGDKPSSTVPYSVQPDPTGKGRNVKTLDALEPTFAVLGLALNRTMRIADAKLKAGRP